MKLRLAMVTPYPERPGIVTGGVEGVSYCLSHGLQQVADLDLHIIAPCIRNKPGIEKRDGMTLHWLAYPRLPRSLTYWNVFRRKIHSRLDQISPDITHFQCTAGFTIGYKKPFVLTIHGINEKDVLYTHGPFVYLRHKLLAQVEKLGRLHTQNFILISPYVMEEVGDQVRGNKWNIENPIDREFFDLDRRKSEPVILFVGRVSQRKNVDGLIRAFEFVHKEVPNAKLRIAGLPEAKKYYDECKRFIEGHSLQEAISFLGNLDRAALLQELAQASCLALVSFQETAPLVVEEAMGAGVPVVASRLCGMPHMIVDGKSGYLVDPKDEKEIGDKLVRLLKNDRLNRQMSERSRLLAREKFHPVQVAMNTAEVYKSVLKQRGKERAMAELTKKEKAKVVLKELLSRAFNLAGGFHIARSLSKHSVTIIAYHRIVRDDHAGVRPYVSIKESELRKQIRFFKKHYSVISLEEAVSRIKHRRVDDHYLVITFDDGYQDNCSLGLRLFLKESVEPIVFITTGCVDKQKMLWPDIVRTIVYGSKRGQQVELNGRGIIVSDDKDKRIPAVKEIISSMKQMGFQERNEFIGKLENVFGVAPPNGRLMLNWEEVRSLRKNGIDVGSHTVDHLILSKASSGVVSSEITDSKKIIEAETGAPVKYFAYPNGTRRDFSDQVIRQIKEAGYEAAVTSIRGVNWHNSDLFQLRRTGIYLTDSLSVIKAKLAFESFCK